ncbi:MAG: hypothetical protein R2726_11525 [Acidimicrobiales bacterium]
MVARDPTSVVDDAAGPEGGVEVARGVVAGHRPLGDAGDDRGAGGDDLVAGSGGDRRAVRARATPLSPKVVSTWPAVVGAGVTVMARSPVAAFEQEPRSSWIV